MINILKNKRKMNKKGVFFTILAIALLSLFLVSYGIYSFVQNREGINKRIKTMNSFVSSLDTDIPRKLYITGYRTIFVLEEDVIKNGEYINDLNSTFKTAFFTGMINGKDYTTLDAEGNLGLLFGVIFPDIKADINEKANSLNINVNFTNLNISISQDDPWSVKISLKSNLIIKDRGGLALWNKTEDYYVYIPIKNFEDPVYLINTNTKVSNKFEQATYEIPMSSSNLIAHAENSYYINHTDAPSFLKRLQGDLSADENGIESLVNTHELSSQGIIPIEKCIIDYIYFSSDNPDYYVPAGVPTWIKIQDNLEHKNIYGS